MYEAQGAHQLYKTLSFAKTTATIRHHKGVLARLHTRGMTTVGGDGFWGDFDLRLTKMMVVFLVLQLAEGVRYLGSSGRC